MDYLTSGKNKKKCASAFKTAANRRRNSADTAHLLDEDERHSQIQDALDTYLKQLQ